ncbi:CsgG/HfaB family protein [Alcanivorax sp. 1008]|uniref:CsgG/HfaB family protein n=1 Tax=Alcanivorax sp. 1008 TaxID=2816853 RepID=UPI001DECEDED|nr:CsgG/HfaB family protein [Alcanivorax sp. 1008]MCC1496851.1 hypothetical protein [Alcanivorax sp. 1008]
MKLHRLIVRLAAALAVALLGTLAHARGDTTTLTVTGFGNTPDMAVSNALVEAVRQSGGASVTLDPLARRPIVEWVAQASSAGSLVVGYSTSVPEPQVPAAGGVQSYRIDQLDRVDERVWKAIITAEAMQYKRVSEKPASAPTLVIEPFLHADTAIIVDQDGTSFPLASVAERLQSDLIEAVIAGSHYRVLDRDYVSAVDRETGISTGSLDPREQLKRARALGADVLLVGQIERASVVELRDIAYGGAFMAFKPRITLMYRLIEVATGEIISTTRYDHIPTQSERARIRQVVAKDFPSEPQEHVYQMLPAVTAALVRSMTGEDAAGQDVVYRAGFNHLVSHSEVRATPGSSSAPIAW